MASHLTLIVDNSAETAAGSTPSIPPHANGTAPVLDSTPEWAPRSRRLRRFGGAMFRRIDARLRDDRGAVTAEYAVVILAAVAFAGLLVAIMRSPEVRQMLVDLVQNALGSAG